MDLGPLATAWGIGPRTKELKSRGKLTPALVAAGVCAFAPPRVPRERFDHEALPDGVLLYVQVHPPRGGLRQRTSRSGDSLM